LVAYPIVRLAPRGVLLRPFVRALELAMADVAASWGITARRRDGYPGCWVGAETALLRKLGALGLRVERGVTYHGIAFNVTTRLTDFGLIDPCGMPGLSVTSVARELGWHGPAAAPSTHSVKLAADRFAPAFAARLDEAAQVTLRSGEAHLPPTQGTGRGAATSAPAPPPRVATPEHA
jgi:lipoyl(octanoyl) transferase